MKMRCKKARKNISLAMDGRLKKAAGMNLQGHLDLCPSCRNWQQEQSALQGMFSTQEALEPGPGFYRKLQMKIDSSPAQGRFFFINPTLFRPVFLRAAMVLILLFAAFIGFSLGNRLDAPAGDGSATVFNQALNLDAFADAPAESFGAVYERLLQGGRP